MNTFGEDLLQSLNETLAHAKGEGPAVLHAPTTPMNDTVLTIDDGGVCVITLNRPARLNAINPALLDGLNAAPRASGRRRAHRRHRPHRSGPRVLRRR